MSRALDAVCADRLVDLREVQRLIPYSRSQIYRLEKAGLFPQRIRLGPGRVVWSLTELWEWIDFKKHGVDWKDAIGWARAFAHA